MFYPASKLNYKRRWTSYSRQKTILISRGLLGINGREPNRAEDWLSHVGYARLSDYFEPFLQNKKNSKKKVKNFLPDARFNQIIDLYSFDRKLKILILDAISRVETSVRANLAYIIGKDYPVIHDKRYAKSIFIKIFFGKKILKQSYFVQWRRKIKANCARNKRIDFLNYKFNTIPIWLLIETWDFGALSTCVYNLDIKYKDLLSKVYGLNGEGEAFANWIKNINHLRNICSHHDRLWNKSFNQLKSSKHKLLRSTNRENKLYGYLSVLYFLLKAIDKNSNWSSRLEKRISKFPKYNFIEISDMGFPNEWCNKPLWNNREGKP